MTPVDPRRHPESPAWAAERFGVALHAVPDARRVDVFGSYRMTRQQADALAIVPAQRAVVIVARAGMRVLAFNPWSEQIAFEDDELRGPSVVEGFFRFELLERFGVDPGETCWLGASMGTLVATPIALTRPLPGGH